MTIKYRRFFYDHKGVPLCLLKNLFWTELENERSPDQTPNIKVAQDSGIYRFTIRFFHFHREPTLEVVCHPLFLYDTDIDSNINYLDIINDWQRTPFDACVGSANIYMKIRYDEVKFNAGFYETTHLVYGYMAPVVKA